MKYLILLIGVFFSALLFHSCGDDGYSLDNVWGAIATAKPLSESSTDFSLVLDDGTTLWPAANYASWYTPKANQRVIVYYTLLSDYFQGYDHAIMIRDIADVLTKYPAEDLGSEGNDEKYGTDPVKIYDMWIGDGYLNVWFGFNYGGKATHFINLVQCEAGDMPYSFEFRHNASDDTGSVGQKGLAAFNLSRLNLEEEVTLTIKVGTFEGDKEYAILYDPATTEANGVRNFTGDDIAALE